MKGLLVRLLLIMLLLLALLLLLCSAVDLASAVDPPKVGTAQRREAFSLI